MILSRPVTPASNQQLLFLTNVRASKFIQCDWNPWVSFAACVTNAQATSKLRMPSVHVFTLGHAVQLLDVVLFKITRDSTMDAR